MRRFGFVQSTAGVLLLVTAIFAVTAACDEQITNPCEYGNKNATVHGLWQAVTIDGRSANNWPLPFPSLDVLVEGAIQFETTTLTGGCKDPEWSSGWAIAIYQIRKPDGSVRPKRYLGRFVEEHATGTVTLSAAGYEVMGHRNGGVLSFTANHALIGNRTLTLFKE